MGKIWLQLVLLQVGVSLIPTDAGQTCSSCSGVDEREGCQHQVVCNNTEACYMHKYTTESGQELSDLGCTLPQACPSVIAPILGKRAEGRHFRCMACCNNTAICNQNLTCGGTTVADAKLPRDCSELVLPVKRNGSYVIFPYGVQQVPASVRCEFIGQDAWTVIQRRYDGSVNFTRSWDIYKSGFGRSDGEYWLGNDFIHILTSNGLNNLRVSLKDWQDITVHADYRAFRIGDEDHDYYLSIWGYSGNAGDSMLYHDGMKFSTIDEDNDENVDDYQHSSQYYTSGKCAVWYGAGWWFKNCFQANLNGKYLRNSRSTEENGIHWNSFHPKNYSLKASTMMIKKS